MLQSFNEKPAYSGKGAINRRRQKGIIRKVTEKSTDSHMEIPFE